MRFSHLTHVRGHLWPLLLLLTSAASEGSVPECRPDNFSACLNGVSSSVTNPAGLRGNLQQYSEIARDRAETEERETAQLLNPHQTGLAAGDTLGNWAVWGNYTRTVYDSDFSFANSVLRYDGISDSALVGLDTLIGERFVLGASFGYLDVGTDTAFNGGAQDSDGYTIAPYGAWLINDTFSVDISGGFSDLEYEQDRISPTDGTTTRADFDSDRWFVSANLNALFLVNDWVLGARVGVLHTEEEQDRYVETGSAASAAGGTLRTVADRDIDLTQVVIGADVAYTFGALEPYGLVMYRNDTSRDDGEKAGGLPGAFTVVQSADDDEFQIGMGVRYFSDFGLSATLEWSLIEGRDSFDSNSLMLTIRSGL